MAIGRSKWPWHSKYSSDTDCVCCISIFYTVKCLLLSCTSNTNTHTTCNMLLLVILVSITITCLLRMFVWLLIYLLYQARGRMLVMFASSIPNRRGGGFVLLFTLYEQVIVTATRNTQQRAASDSDTNKGRLQVVIVSIYIIIIRNIFTA